MKKKQRPRRRSRPRQRQGRLAFAPPRRLAGVDEAGRGPLAGPVVAAAVILDPARPIRGLADSKILLPAVRERLSERIRVRALAWSIAWADREEIDALNIFQATMLAMRRALLGLRVAPDEVQIDGNRCPSLDGLDLRCGVLPVVKGDASVPAISAASILAKTFRDARMRALDGLYPQYGFAAHKGYCTRAHLTALDTHGACPLHRRSFAPVYVQQLIALHGGQLLDDDSLEDADEADFELCLDLEGNSTQVL
jgi:ribonuclease HII